MRGRVFEVRVLEQHIFALRDPQSRQDRGTFSAVARLLDELVVQCRVGLEQHDRIVVRAVVDNDHLERHAVEGLLSNLPQGPAELWPVRCMLE